MYYAGDLGLRKITLSTHFRPYKQIHKQPTHLKEKGIALLFATMGPVHGKACEIFHDGRGIYSGMPNPLVGGRYHSLAMSRLADGLVCTAKTADGVIMGVRHKEYSIEGVQFHPESVLAPDGRRMMRNFLDSVG